MAMQPRAQPRRRTAEAPLTLVMMIECLIQPAAMPSPPHDSKRCGLLRCRRSRASIARPATRSCHCIHGWRSASRAAVCRLLRRDPASTPRWNNFYLLGAAGSAAMLCRTKPLMSMNTTREIEGAALARLLHAVRRIITEPTVQGWPQPLRHLAIDTFMFSVIRRAESLFHYSPLMNCTKRDFLTAAIESPSLKTITFSPRLVPFGTRTLATLIDSEGQPPLPPDLIDRSFRLVRKLGLAAGNRAVSESLVQTQHRDDPLLVDSGPVPSGQWALLPVRDVVNPPHGDLTATESELFGRDLAISGSNSWAYYIVLGHSWEYMPHRFDGQYMERLRLKFPPV